jgi:hypothetical protein
VAPIVVLGSAFTLAAEPADEFKPFVFILTGDPELGKPDVKATASSRSTGTASSRSSCRWRRRSAKPSWHRELGGASKRLLHRLAAAGTAAIVVHRRTGDG